MISVLIPIYNYNCSQLIASLARQQRQLGDSFCEIIAMDDGSELFVEENRYACRCHNVAFIHHRLNQGRSRIRNLLAAQAKGQWLVFMDCDSAIPDNDYLNRYLQQTRLSDAQVICGGRIVEEISQILPDFLLHWKCCARKEPVADSNRHNHHFLSNNFLISRQAFDSVGFEERLKGYGHEDTLFGLQLHKAGYQISYINNPVIHIGLDQTDSFISKSREAIINLRTLYTEFLSPEDARSISLLNFYFRVRTLHLSWLFSLLYNVFGKAILRQLHSSHPNLMLWDLYKAGMFCHIMK